jgi:gliding motility-associated-like protein
MMGLYYQTTSCTTCVVGTPLAVNITNQTNVQCFGETNGSSSVNATGGNTPYTYLWSPSGGTGSTASGLGAGTYTVTVTDANGCSSTATVSITSPSQIVPATLQTDTGCVGDNGCAVSVNVNGGTSPYTYSWIPSGATSSAVSGIGGGTYTVNITDANGCTAAQSITVVEYPLPAALFACPSVPIDVGQTVTFTDSSTGAVSWSWSFGDGGSSSLQNPSYVYTTFGNYTVVLTVTNQYGCRDTYLCPIAFSEYISVPNVFSPNNDNTNDLFFIPNTGMVEYHIIIFNRWGVKMFESVDPGNHWDGRTTTGIEASDGTYYYILSSKSVSGTEYEFKGFLTLIR